MNGTSSDVPFEKTFRLVCRLDDADIDYVRDTAEWIRRCVARALELELVFVDGPRDHLRQCAHVMVSCTNPYRQCVKLRRAWIDLGQVESNGEECFLAGRSRLQFPGVGTP